MKAFQAQKPRETKMTKTALLAALVALTVTQAIAQPRSSGGGTQGYNSQLVSSNGMNSPY
jgi:hypothetical protein